jgi:hypothetical protein
MRFPTVTEITPRLEPVTPDPFCPAPVGPTRLRPPAPVPARIGLGSIADRVPRAAACTLAVVVVMAAPAIAEPRLPDLEQEPPSGLIVTDGALDGQPGTYRLGFRSAVRNVGRGPLIISAHRRSRATPTMAATQLVRDTDGTVRRLRGAGRVRYVVSPTHRHWHLLTFDRYTLRRVGGSRVVRRDRKTGFCLGDRYRMPGPMSSPPAFTSSCGLRQPGRLRVTEGISVGYGDDYAATLEGQYVDLTGLPRGRYRLTHEVNPHRRLAELSYDNNRSSVLLSLRWIRGMPSVRVLGAPGGGGYGRIRLSAPRSLYCTLG